MEIVYKEEAYAVIGACFEVYNDKGRASWRRSIRNASEG